MADQKTNAYQVKLKLIPISTGFKHGFVSGLVLAKTQPEAISIASEDVKESLKTKGIHVETKVQSIVKLRQDFFYIAENCRE